MAFFFKFIWFSGISMLVLCMAYDKNVIDEPYAEQQKPFVERNSKLSLNKGHKNIYNMMPVGYRSEIGEVEMIAAKRKSAVKPHRNLYNKVLSNTNFNPKSLDNQNEDQYEDENVDDLDDEQNNINDNEEEYDNDDAKISGNIADTMENGKIQQDTNEIVGNLENEKVNVKTMDEAIEENNNRGEIAINANQQNTKYTNENIDSEETAGYSNTENMNSNVDVGSVAEKINENANGNLPEDFVQNNQYNPNLDVRLLNPEEMAEREKLEEMTDGKINVKAVDETNNNDYGNNKINTYRNKLEFNQNNKVKKLNNLIRKTNGFIQDEQKMNIEEVADDNIDDSQKESELRNKRSQFCCSSTTTCPPPSFRPPCGPKLIVIPAECTDAAPLCCSSNKPTKVTCCPSNKKLVSNNIEENNTGDQNVDSIEYVQSDNKAGPVSDIVDNNSDVYNSELASNSIDSTNNEEIRTR